ncbi:MAG: hypothetical protein WKG00_02655, partial [Polyangiaceae bacterium]
MPTPSDLVPRIRSFAGVVHEEAQDGPTRGELFSADRLVEHARQLAAAHGEPSITIPVRPLLATFEATKHAIERAYQGLEDDKRDPTPGEEWLFDNSHVVDDQLREIREDLPRGYLAELPRLTGGSQVGLPRVYALTLDFVSHTDARIDLDTLVKYVAA